MIKLDYTLESPEERKALVEKIIEENPNLTPRYLEILADYLVLCMEKQERKERKILTENRLATVNKRECSFEGLVSKFENGEDGIYNIMSDNKHEIFSHKISITQHDLDTIPCLRQLREAINSWEELLKRSSGKDKYIIKKALIEMRKDQYLIKQAYQKPIILQKKTKNLQSHIPLDDNSIIEKDKDGEYQVKVDGVSLMDPRVTEAILCNYSKLKAESYDQFDRDMWYLIQTFEETCDRALVDFPIYTRIIELKIDKKQNNEIQEILQEEFDTTYSIEYISSLWRNKIPKLIAQQAREDFIRWWYNYHNLPMKKCSKCGQEKPAHNDFFSKNKTSKDHFYSICKRCRNKKRG